MRVGSVLFIGIFLSFGCNESRLGGYVAPAPEPTPEDSFIPPGSGDPGYVVEEFDAQVRGGQVDLLWVIDDSDSMGADQDNLILNISRFIEKLTDGVDNLDFRLAVTTTAVYYPGLATSGQWDWKTVNGRFMHYRDTNSAFSQPNGHPAVLTSKMSRDEIVQGFGANARVGTSRGPAEQGLEAARLALANTHGFADNNSFLRENALLAIVFVSDERDQSMVAGPDYFPEIVGASQQPDDANYYVNHYVDFFRELKPRASQVHLTAIHNPSQAEGYLEAIQLAETAGLGTLAIAGLIGSGTSDWSATLDNLGASVATSVEPIFTLGSLPEVTTITVSIDGTKITSSPSTWFYSETDNAVVWVSSDPLLDVDKVVISYKAITP